LIFFADLQFQLQQQPSSYSVASFEIAYSAQINQLVSSWEKLNALREVKNSSVSKLPKPVNERQMKILEEYHSQIQAEIIDTAKFAICILSKYYDRNQGKCTDSDFATIILLIADFYRYIAIYSGDDRAKNLSEKFFLEVEKYAQLNLSEIHQTRIRTAHHRAKLHAEIFGDIATAVAIATRGFNDAVMNLDNICTEDSYKGCTILLQLLRDDLTFWTDTLRPNVDDNSNETGDSNTTTATANADKASFVQLYKIRAEAAKRMVKRELLL